MSLKDKILAKKLKSKEITVDGEKIRIRELTGSERIGLSDIEDSRELAAFVFLKAADLGEPVSEDDFVKMFDLDVGTVTEIIQEIYDLSGLGIDKLEEAEKN